MNLKKIAIASTGILVMLAVSTPVLAASATNSGTSAKTTVSTPKPSTKKVMPVKKQTTKPKTQTKAKTN